MRFRLAWNNLWRKPLRTSLLMISSAITAGVIFLSYFFIISMDRSLSVSRERFGADVMVVPQGYGTVAGQLLLSGTVSSFYMPGDVLEKVREIPEVEKASPQLYLTTFSGSCCHVEGEFPVVAFDPQTDFTLKEWTSGIGKRLFTSDSVLIGNAAGGVNALYHLDYDSYQERVTLFNHPFEVTNVLYPTGTGVDKTLFIDIRKAREIRKTGLSKLSFDPNAISVVLVKTNPGDEEFVRRQIERTIPGVSAVTGIGIREMIHHQLMPLRLLSYSMIGVVLLMAGLQAMTLFSAVVSERKREIGILRALGAKKRKVYQLFIEEAGLTSGMGAITGVLIVIITLYDNRVLIRKTIQLPLLFPGMGGTVAIILMALCVTIGIGFVAASFPIRSILRQEPYQAIREGE